MKEPKIDVAVLLLFFTRTEQTSHTFAQIRKARPSKLFLYQDGPRPNREDDISNIIKCRQTVESMIDWDCEVYKFYQEKNFGCDPSEYLSQKWMFTYVDKGIIIEDDDVMSESFFPFCKELLDRYENDTRINMICGQNHLGVYDTDGDDYFFTRGGGIWGWATWKRTIDKWDPQYGFINDSRARKLLGAKIGEKRLESFIKTCTWHKNSGKEYYESLRNANQFVEDQMNIVPAKNMTCNIGIGAETTHFSNTVYNLPRAIRKLLFSKTYEIQFPLQHPKYVIEDVPYWAKASAVLNGNKCTKLFHLRWIETIIYKLFPVFSKIGMRDYQKRVDYYTKTIADSK